MTLAQFQQTRRGFTAVLLEPLHSRSISLQFQLFPQEGWGDASFLEQRKLEFGQRHQQVAYFNPATASRQLQLSNQTTRRTLQIMRQKLGAVWAGSREGATDHQPELGVRLGTNGQNPSLASTFANREV